MVKSKVKLGTRRVFSEEFKRARVSEYESGEFTVREICSLYKIKKTSTVYNWIYKYSSYNKKGLKVVEMSKSSTQKVKELEKRIKELEGVVGQKQLKLDYLEILLSLAKEEYGLDLKKNSNTKPSSS